MILGHCWDTINIFRCWKMEAFKGFKDVFKRVVQWYCTLWFYSVKNDGINGTEHVVYIYIIYK